MENTESLKSSESIRSADSIPSSPSAARTQRGRVNRMQEARSGSKFLRPLVKDWESQGYAVTGLVGMMEFGWELGALGVPDSMREVFRAKLNQVQSADEYCAWATAQMGGSGGKQFKATLKTLLRRCQRLRQIVEKAVERLQADGGVRGISADDFNDALKFHNDRLDKMPQDLGVGRHGDTPRSMPWETQLKRTVGRVRLIVDSNASEEKYPMLHWLLSELEKEMNRIQPPKPGDMTQDSTAA